MSDSAMAHLVCSGSARAEAGVCPPGYLGHPAHAIVKHPYSHANKGLWASANCYPSPAVLQFESKDNATFLGDQSHSQTAQLMDTLQAGMPQHQTGTENKANHRNRGQAKKKALISPPELFLMNTGPALILKSACFPRPSLTFDPFLFVCSQKHFPKAAASHISGCPIQCLNAWM